jgi:excisionase family DNA binding protein
MEKKMTTEPEQRPTIGEIESLLLSAAEVAALLNISTRTLWRLLSARQVPEPIRLGGSVRWRREEVETWIARGCPETAN